MQFKLLLALSSWCLVAGVLQQESEIHKEWLNFKQNFGKSYRSVEDNEQSFKNFKENFELIQKHNKLYEQNLVTYKMAVNPYTDMTLKDMEKGYMGLKISEKDEEIFLKAKTFSHKGLKKPRVSDTKDWRIEGAISEVKNQGGCGSCWAFSSTGALEAHHFLKHNKSVLISEQNLVDCVKECHGCQGGWMIPSFEYVRTNKGIDSEKDYPYEAVNQQCRFKAEFIAATCEGFSSIKQNDEQELLEVVDSVGPVSVAISANSNFMGYKEGVFNDPNCSQAVNHAVLVVGYGSENDQDYWLVKNSWGTEWGDKGYIKMARNKENQCAIAKYASYPLV